MTKEYTNHCISSFNFALEGLVIMKKHFKLYKAGKLWLVGAIATLSVMIGGQQVLADTTTVPDQQQPVITQPTTKSGQPTQPKQQPAQPTAPAKQPADQGALSAVKSNGIEVNKGNNWYLQNKQGQNLNGWQKLNDNRTVYYDPSNNAMVHGEKQLNTYWYHFDENNGQVSRGFTTLKDGRHVYYDKNNGQMQHGLTKVGKNTYYYFALNNGNMLRGEHNINNHWYNFGTNGVMLTGKQTVAGNRTVYYNDQGQMQYGLTKVGKNTYYFALNNGNMLKGEIQDHGHWYYFGNDGHMITGFATIPGNREVYYNANGQMVYGDQLIKGKWYYFAKNNGDKARHGLTFDSATKTLKYFDDNGVRQSGIFEGYTFDSATGSLKTNKTGEKQINGHWYFVNTNGTLATGFKKIAGNRTVYYNPSNARMIYGEANIGGHWYYFAPNNGNMAKGLTTLPDGRHVYYNKDNGQMQYGEQKVNGNWYYFATNNGNQTVGFFTLPDGRHVYYDQQGRMAHGFFNANGVANDYSAHWADNAGVIHSVHYFSQYTPIMAPWGCAPTALAMLMSVKNVYPSLGTLIADLPKEPGTPGGQTGNQYSGVGFTHVITAAALTNYAHRWSKDVRNISGTSLSGLIREVQSGHPVLYYGYSAYDAGGARNHCKVIYGYNNKTGLFHVYDPLYGHRGRWAAGTTGHNRYDLGYNAWVSWGSIASEYAGNALTIY